jgi:D-alanyl-D-alanine carboxypeptidase/D-alanyl-D-alanine-endopeptidase (penicillin-binding protein 4)
MMDRRFSSTWAVLAFVIAVAAGQPGASAAELTNALRQMIQGHDLRDTKVTLFVMDLDTGTVLGSISPDDQMIPASNMKVVTTIAAMDVLGIDHVFRTELGVIDAVAGGFPSLVVVGDGDPAFGDPQLLAQHNLQVEQLLDGWVQAIAATGHKRFDRLIIDDRVFDQEFSHPDWAAPNLIRAFGAQVAGVNFYANVLDVLPTPTAAGQAPAVELFPPAPFIETINRARTGNTDFFTLDRRLGTNQIIYGGTVRNRPASPFQITIHDPPMVFGQVLTHRLRLKGIEVGEVVRPAPREDLPNHRPIHVVQTTLPLVLARTNQDSQNMFAEALIKRIGRQLTGQPGSWENGAAAVRHVLHQRLGPRAASINVADGSGMSRNNQVTARLLVELLRSVHQDSEKAVIFRDSLSRGGVNGTLANRFDGMNGVVFGKSGYISGVSSLSGYLYLPPSQRHPNPRTIGFAIFMNGFRPPLYNNDMRALQNRLVDLIDQSLADPVRMGG